MFRVSPEHSKTQPMTTRPIRFHYRGRVCSVDHVAPTLTLLDWLREHAHHTGTKEGCNEGDCGACTVILAELADPPAPDATTTRPFTPLGQPPGMAGAACAVVGGLRLRPVNACLQFLPTLDGKAVLTVEDVQGITAAAQPGTGGTSSASPDAAPATASGTAPLHPVQQALVQCHASQCGFCTPGFVMTLAATYEHHQNAGSRPSRAALADALSGNLCRCTGYRPIIDAGVHMFELPAVRIDTAPIVAALRELRKEPALHYSGPNAAGGAEQRFHAPRRLGDLAWLMEMHPDARLLAGATDVGLWVNKQLRDLGEIIYVGEVAELKTIVRTTRALQIGAAVALEDAWAALAQTWPELTEVWRRFASPLIRHAGTLGGNVANGSPIGDGAPVLLALDARLVLQRCQKTRTLPLSDFYLDYMKNDLQPGEFIVSIDVPLPQKASGVRNELRVWKLSKRFDSDISAVCGAFALQLQGGTVRSVRLAYGGMAATVRRAAATEQALLGQPWCEETVRSAIVALDSDFEPLTDLRASSSYRRRSAANLLWRLWLETRADAPLSAAQTSVWRADTPAT